MPYVVRIGNCEVECETVEEVHELVGMTPLAASKEKKPLKENDVRSRSGSATQRSWQEAMAYDKEHGIPLMEARAELAAVKRGDMEPRAKKPAMKKVVKKRSRKRKPWYRNLRRSDESCDGF